MRNIQKKISLLFILCFAFSVAFAQTVKLIDNKGTLKEVGNQWANYGNAIYNKNTGNIVISNGNVPASVNGNAALQFTTTDKGILIPKVSLSATNIYTPFVALAAADQGLLVYNTATAGTSPNNVIPGFYYWDTSSWKAISSTIGTPLNSGQIIVGNASNKAAAVTMSGDVTISNSGVTTIGASKVTNDKLDKTNIPLSGFGAATANVSMGIDVNHLFRITNLASPINDSDAATLLYVDEHSTPLATTVITGRVQLAGDLTGTAILPLVANNAITSAKILDGTIATVDIADANVTNAKLANSAVTINGTSVSLGAAATITASPVGTSLASTKILVGDVSNTAQPVSMSGDANISNTGALTLATINANTGSFGNSTTIPSFTVNAKGLITAAGSAAIPILNQNTTGNAATATTATNASNSAITNDVATNATVYPTWVTANTGNLPLKVSSSKFSFNPFTGSITASGDAYINGLTVGKGNGNFATNTALGVSALANNTGVDNTALGSKALSSNTGGGTQNTAVGGSALEISNGNDNVAIGFRSLVINTSGNQNIAVGTKALGYNEVSINNVAIGYQALYSTDGDGGNGVTSGSNNIGIGTNAGYTNQNGVFNTYIGSKSGHFASGNYNTSLGGDSFKSPISGNNNVAIGYNAFSVTINNGVNAYQNSGNDNTIIGYQAQFNGSGISSTSNQNTIIGANASATSGLSNATAIGNAASVTASNTIQLGNASVNNVKTFGTITAGAITYPNTGGTSGQVLTTDGSVASWGTTNAAITNDNLSNATVYPTWVTANTGNLPLKVSSSKFSFNPSTGSITSTGDATINGLTIGKGPGNGANNVSNTAIGIEALSSINDWKTYPANYDMANTGAIDNVAVGNQVLKRTTDGTANTGVGKEALAYNTTGDENTALGMVALLSNTIGDQNTAVGKSSMFNNTSGIQNTAIGVTSLNANTSGSYNTALGLSALLNTNASATAGSGSYNTAVGNSAGSNITTGSNNVAIGYLSGPLAANATISNSIAIGNTAVVSANNSTAIGSGAIANGSNSTAIGSGAIANANNTIQLGNSSVTDIYGGNTVAATGANFRGKAFLVNSDKRIKKDIINSKYGLATILKLRPVDYHLINDVKQDPQVGFIAQEVKAVVPELVTGKEGDLSKGEILGVNYAGLAPILTKAIQEQEVKITAQEDRSNVLQTEITDLKAQLKMQEAEINELKALLHKVLETHK